MNEKELKKEITKAFDISILPSEKSNEKDIYFFEFALLSPVQTIKIVYNKKTSKFKVILRTVNIKGIILRDTSYEKIKTKAKEIYGFKCKKIKKEIVIETKWIKREEVGKQVIDLVFLSNDVDKELFG